SLYRPPLASLPRLHTPLPALYVDFPFMYSFSSSLLSFFFFNDTATTEIYTLSLHDALPISQVAVMLTSIGWPCNVRMVSPRPVRSEEHTSELQSLTNLVCRLLLEKKKNEHPTIRHSKRRSDVLHSKY